jgi:hypothetical protein
MGVYCPNCEHFRERDGAISPQVYKVYSCNATGWPLGTSFVGEKRFPNFCSVSAKFSNQDNSVTREDHEYERKRDSAVGEAYPTPIANIVRG